MSEVRLLIDLSSLPSYSLHLSLTVIIERVSKVFRYAIVA